MPNARGGHAKLDEHAEKLAAAEKELSQLRADRDAANKQIADTTRKYVARIKEAEDAAQKSRQAEERARLRAKEANREAAAATLAAAKVPGRRRRRAWQKERGRQEREKQPGRRSGSREAYLAAADHPSFSELDKNHDGRLSQAEYKAGFPDASDVEEEFKALDTNHDGFLSIDEYKAGHPDPAVIRVPRGKKN